MRLVRYELCSSSSSAFPITWRRVPGEAYVLSNVGRISEIVVTNRAGTTVVILIEKQVHRLQALGAVLNGHDNGVDKFIVWKFHAGGGGGGSGGGGSGGRGGGDRLKAVQPVILSPLN